MENLKNTVIGATKSFLKDPIGVSFDAGIRFVVVCVGLYIMFCSANCGAQILISAVN